MSEQSPQRLNEWLAEFLEHIEVFQEACISLGYWDNLEDQRALYNSKVTQAYAVLLSHVALLLNALPARSAVPFAPGPPKTEGPHNDQTPA